MPEQVAQDASHVLHILLSNKSAYSFVLVQEAAQALVPLFPTRGSRQAVTQVVPDKNLRELQDRQEVAVPEQVKQLGSQVLQILLSLISTYSLELVHVDAQALVPLLPTEGLGQALTQVRELRNSGEAQVKH